MPSSQDDGIFHAAGKLVGNSLQQDVFQDEQNGQHIHQGADLLLLGLAGDDVEQGPGDDAMAMPSEML